MQTELLTVDAGTSLRQCVQRMDAARTGYALVVRDGQPFAIVTEWDLLHKVLATSIDPDRTTVETIASSPLVSVDSETSTYDLVEMMADRGIRRMVVTQGGQVVGIVTAKGVLAAFRKYVDRLSSEIGRMQAPPP
ncbi:MAG: CBS domain-containing protein [Thermoplasmata archaeon]|nr:CBS domain-containing protein [Thermoplasmata archaeon]